MTKTAVQHAKSTSGKKRSRGRSAQETSERPVVLIRLPDIRPAEVGTEEHRSDRHASQPQPSSPTVQAEDTSSARVAAECERPTESLPITAKAAKEMPWSPPAEPWLANPPTKRLLQIAAAATLIVLVISAYLVATAVRPGRVAVTPADRTSAARMEIPHLPSPDFYPVPPANSLNATPTPDESPSGLPPALPKPEESADTKSAGPELLEPLTASSDPPSTPNPNSEESPSPASRTELPPSEADKPEVSQPEVSQPEAGGLEIMEPSTAPAPQPSAPASETASGDAPAQTEPPQDSVQAASSYPVTDPATFQYPAYQDLFRAPAGRMPQPGSDRWRPNETQPNTARLQPNIVPPPMR